MQVAPILVGHVASWKGRAKYRLVLERMQKQRKVLH